MNLFWLSGTTGLDENFGDIEGRSGLWLAKIVNVSVNRLFLNIKILTITLKLLHFKTTSNLRKKAVE